MDRLVACFNHPPRTFERGNKMDWRLIVLEGKITYRRITQIRHVKWHILPTFSVQAVAVVSREPFCQNCGNMLLSRVRGFYYAEM